MSTHNKTLIKQHEDLPKVKNRTEEIQQVKQRLQNIGIVNKLLLEEVSAKLKMSISQHLTGVIRFKTALNLNHIKLSEKACATNNKNHPIEFPTKAKREEYIKNGLSDLWLSGFDNNDGGCCFNFILSNGHTSKTVKDAEMHTMMLPQERFHLVRVFSGDKVFGFQFFDSNLQLRFEIGHC